MKYIKENWKFLLFIFIAGIIGCYFAVLYTINSVTEEMMNEAIKQVGSKEMVILISIIQSIVYSVLMGAFGIILSNKIGLWKKIAFEKNKILTASLIALIGGLVILFADLLIFGNFNDLIKHSFDTKPTFDLIIASFFYGGVIEEVMMRLFLMSLFSWIIIKIFYKNKEVPVKVFVIANIISALLFAAGHLPVTITTFGQIDAMLLIRCFLLNGAFGLAFGWLYRKYGIQYSMIAHFGCHFVSKILWLLFI